MSQRQLRILMVTGSYPPMMCGVGDYTEGLVNALRKCGLEVRVLTMAIKFPPDGKVQNSETWIRRVVNSWGMRHYKVFLDEVKAFSPDIVHIQDPTQGYSYATAPVLMVLLASLAKPMNIIWTWHEFVPKIYNKRLIAFHLMALLSKVIIFVRYDFKEQTPHFLSLLLRKKPFEFIPNASVIPKIDMNNESITRLRQSITTDEKQIIVFFGFIYPNKRVESLFEIADPRKHHLVLIGNLDPKYDYHQRILSLSEDPQWSGSITMLGFLGAKEAGEMIKIADAVVLPYAEGAGSWNTSLHAATLQGTFVLTTSLSQKGYDSETNIFYADVGDVASMRMALEKYAGMKRDVKAIEDPWVQIAQNHIKIYKQIL
jgi:glycosyltransferase involved in cell wall biosynthesis